MTPAVTFKRGAARRVELTSWDCKLGMKPGAAAGQEFALALKAHPLTASVGGGGVWHGHGAPVCSDAAARNASISPAPG